MHENKDFLNMTLDELTPIVSMRPGKEYTKEELRLARTAFMQKLGCINPEIEPEVDLSPAETDAEENAMAEAPEAIVEEVVPAVETFDVPETEAPTVFAEVSAPLTEAEDIPSAIEAEVDSVEPPAEEASAPLEAEAVPAPPKEEAEAEPEGEAFILKADSRLARFLYRLYAYLLLPILALEALSLLVASVGTAVVASGTPFIFIHVICAAAIAMFIAISWHQFLYRTKLGQLLNRSLIGVCIIRGFCMLTSGTDILWGVIFIALSALFLVYFIGYDSMFIIPSPKQQRVQ